MTGSARDEYDDLCHALMAEIGATQTQMMGMPSLKRNGKLFAGFREGALIVRIGRERASELIDSGRAVGFDPSGMGRSMKDWATVGPPTDDWHELAVEAAEYTT
jgi:hypothetical protein